MKKILLALLLLFPTQLEGQAAFWWGTNTVSTDINGGSIEKGDTIALEVKLNPAGTNIRSAYFDFQHQKDAISLIAVERGPAIPADAGFSVNNYFYPNCQFNRNVNNTTNNGWTNYTNSNYTCNASTVPYNAINRIMVNVSTNQMLLQATYITLKFEITNTDAGFPYDSVYMNFAFGYDANGSTMTNTENVGDKGVWVEFDPSANNLIAGEVKLNQNVPQAIREGMFVNVTDTNDPPNSVASVSAATGNFNLASELSSNTNYQFRVLVPSEDYNALSVEATTVSDYTAAVTEFITQNLDGTYKNQNINHGIKYWAADVNNNNVFNGEDVQILFNAVTGLDTIMVAPDQCGQGCSMSLPVFTTNAYDNMNFDSWKTLTPQTTNFVPVTTSTVEQNVSINYVLKGDVNLSHSSPLTQQAAAAPAQLVEMDPSINVNLTNVIVTNDDITIPFEVDTGGMDVVALQFEVVYDPTKVKFEELKTDTPSWVTFINNGDGVIRFGGLDRNLKNTINGQVTPFSLKFSSLAAGVDMNSQVSLTRNLDAANGRGDQVGIKLNTSVVKLIGVNNFVSK